MPPNPPSNAHGFVMRSMSLRDMQISKSEKKILGPPCQILGTPLTLHYYAIDVNCSIQCKSQNLILEVEYKQVIHKINSNLYVTFLLNNNDVGVVKLLNIHNYSSNYLLVKL